MRKQGRTLYVEARDTNVLRRRASAGGSGDLIDESQRCEDAERRRHHDAPIPVHIAEALQLDSPLAHEIVSSAPG